MQIPTPRSVKPKARRNILGLRSGKAGSRLVPAASVKRRRQRGAKSVEYLVSHYAL
jgi:hypothetical protein